jgi:tRNA (mo5U34)-methyltransferase
MSETREELQRQIDAIDWYHEFDFGDGLRAVTKSDAALHRRFWKFIEMRLDTIDFKGKTVLDIGCWDGYWSFYAERRGAKRVLATDDVSQNWAHGTGLHLAKRLLKSNIEINESVSIYEASKLRETFDIVLCLGVYYHLIDPFAAFAQLRHCSHTGSIVVLEGDVTHGLRADSFFWDPKDSAKPIFIPTDYGLRQMLRAAYFEVTEQSFMQPIPLATVFKPELSLFKHVAGRQDAETLKLPEYMDRMVTFAKPFEGENPLHPYKPPFGLNRYDPRYR